jgi:hypothetical protein
MRKASLLLLCIILSATLILPVAGKKGGGESPTQVNLSGDIECNGPAKFHDTKKSLTLSVGEEGKKQDRFPISFSEKWPDPFGGNTYESYKTFVNVYGYKDGSYFVRLTIGHEDENGHFVVKGTGFYEWISADVLKITLDQVNLLGETPESSEIEFIVMLAS